MAKIIKLDVPVMRMRESWDLTSSNMVLDTTPRTGTYKGKPITLYKVINLCYPISDWSMKLLINRIPNLYTWEGEVYAEPLVAKEAQASAP